MKLYLGLDAQGILSDWNAREMCDPMMVKDMVVVEWSGVLRRSEPRTLWMEPAKVLVVDDHADTVTALKMLLETIGHDVVTASSGAEALAVAALEVPELVLLDIQLGDMRGETVAQRLREQARGRPMGVIALTGEGPRDLEVAGFDRHLLKPVDAATLDLNMRIARELSYRPRS